MYHPDINPSATYDYGSGPVAYRTNEYGPYSYYIDNTFPGATDTGRPFGTHAAPRVTWPDPDSVSSGTVVMTAGGGTYTFANDGSGMAWGGPGTSSRPNFWIGVGASTNIADRPKLNRGEGSGIPPRGSWSMLSWFVLTNDSQIHTRAGTFGSPMTNIAVRGLIAIGNGAADNNDQVISMTEGSAAAYVNGFVVFTNVMQNYGLWTNATQNDACAVIFRQYLTNGWMLMNDTEGFGGDSVRVGANEDNDLDNAFCDFLYVAHNKMNRNGENAVDVKKSHRAVISENDIYDFNVYVPTAGEGAIVIHYNPNYTWFINNRFHDGLQAINTGSRMNATNEIWVIGNEFFDYSDSALYWRAVFTNYVYGNTFYNCGRFIEESTSGANAFVYSTNNLAVNSSITTLDFQNSSGRGRLQSGYDNYYDNDGLFDIEWGVNYSSVSDFDAAVANVGNLLSVDPLFVSAGANNFNLSSSSPMINAGVDMSAQMEAAFLAQFGFALNYRDRNGNALSTGGGVDIGALQFAEEAAPSGSIPGGLILNGVSLQ